MSRRRIISSSEPRLCVAGLVYFEIFLPESDLDIPLDREVFVDSIDVGLGGALNPSSVAASLGIDTTLAHPRGHGLTDAAVAARIDRLGLDTRCWSTDDDPALSLVRSESGDRGFLSRADYDSLRDCPGLIDFDWLHVPGLEEAYRLDGPLNEARRAGATISVAGSWAPARLDELHHHQHHPWDVLILNAAEARRALGNPDGDVPSLIAEFRAFDPTVLITDGPRAVHAVVDGELLCVETPPADDFVDATGAGDAFGAGFISARLHNYGPVDAIEFGARVASTVVGLHGGVVYNSDQLEDLNNFDFSS